ncbi:MAG: type I DNA topoisomerase [Actinobacteria bacterium]|uniref:DNA topoisomerase n=1 Tax=freshwater metagenome TaxID=449393 RepID=A0A6J7UNC6_9ZZZZ|nr:type I DNA topoisomerase [Actinomycetota bacterium]
MARPLVVVESPAKAKTIARFLGNEFDVRASVGHVADLPRGGMAVDVENGFKPTYELTERGRQVVKDLRAALKDASELYLATDEDREGEAISWHLLEYLKPKVPVKRMVFHEITKAAIDHAVANPRGLDYGLVDAAETRRILDRLYGYEVSPVLWRKINRGLSAGRVQSPAIRLVVQREQERIAFVSAGYWDIAALSATSPAFTSTLIALNGARVASGKDFDASGTPKKGTVVVDGARAKTLASALSSATFTVRSVEDKPYRSSPKAPFMTSTLQQEGGRKLRLSAAQVMRLAQSLYERGFITYMRTDSVSLSEEALGAVRSEVKRVYGQSHVAQPVRHFANKVKNAQEAHEGIRPTTPLRAPDQVAAELNGQELALYRLVWQRTLASQMADAVGTTVSVRIGAAVAEDAASAPTDCEFATAGTTITFTGYRAVYVESTDEGESTEEREAQLPVLTVGAVVPMAAVTPEGHSTTPPARYTEASLVKKLEELGIGRPSTWANTILTIFERGYIWKKGTALVPTWTAFAVVNLLDKHFGTLVDYAFTAELENDLDAIARNEMQKTDWLQRFYFGDEPGLKALVETKIGDIDAAEVNTFPLGIDPDTGEEIVVKPGKYGPYVKRGEDTASVPDDLAPDELTLAKAKELLSLPKSDEPIGEIDGLPVFAKTGRYGPYVQWGAPDQLPPGLDKPKMASLFKTMTVERMTVDQAKELLSLPRGLGADPADGVEVVANNGRYGPYVQKGAESRSIDNEEQLLTITLEQALPILAAPKQYRGRGGGGAPKAPLRDFGSDPVSSRAVTAKEGKFGVYVTDGETNASISKGDRIESMTPERAYELLAARREAMALKGDTPAKRGARKAPAAKKAPAKKAPAKKTAAKKAPAKKAAAKKAAPRKSAS